MRIISRYSSTSVNDDVSNDSTVAQALQWEEPGPRPDVDDIKQATGHHPGRTIILYISTVIALTLGLSAALLIYIYALQEARLEGLAIVSTADLQFIVAISQALSTVVVRTVPVLVLVHAFKVAADWLSATTLECPTPLQ